MARVSIGLPVWNGEKYLPQALNSILAQSFEDFELLISDNASTDSTAKIIADYCRRDSRITSHRHDTNLGAAANFNYVFHNTSAEYFKWAAYDDVMAPTYLAACVAVFDADDGGTALAYPQTMMIAADGTPLRLYEAVTRKGGATPSERLRQLIGSGNHIQSLLHMCFPVFGLMRREILAQTSLIANMPRSDHLLLVELALKGRFIEIEEPLFLRREHDHGSVISAEKAASGVEVEKLLAAWFDPRKDGKFPATVTRLGFGYLRGVLRTPMTPAEWLTCQWIALGWLKRHWRIIGGECKIVLRERLKAPDF
jgi:glycosyltransferase involved in cell wall biosynthesis